MQGYPRPFAKDEHAHGKEVGLANVYVFDLGGLHRRNALRGQAQVGQGQALK